ncbi:FimV/HubP family polar landmark protein [Psychrobacter sp. I-STPA6b]|uniref:FimV/HubP family polar landmark protein n=1 Tax=Psychrobacter sp. I-STPA6b TaxID=2585718 RepID=UPI001D0C66BA|nr:FimV/HubP family polar landmark protein [Psychrobacter sp. I-STPA6b]
MNILLYIIIGLIVLLTIILFLMRSKNSAKQASTQTVAPVSPKLEQETKTPVPTPIPEKDPITVAQTYIDQQRYDDASEVLTKGLSTEPKNTGYMLKLLSVYALNNKQQDFETLYQRIQSEADLSTLQQAKEIRSSFIDPSLEVASETIVNSDSPVVDSTPNDTLTDDELMFSLDDDLVLDAEESTQDSLSTEAPALDNTALDSTDLTLDSTEEALSFDDLESQLIEDAKPELTTKATTDSQVDDDLEFSFDNELELDNAEGLNDNNNDAISIETPTTEDDLLADFNIEEPLATQPEANAPVVEDTTDTDITLTDADVFSLDAEEFSLDSNNTLDTHDSLDTLEVATDSDADSFDLQLDEPTLQDTELEVGEEVSDISLETSNLDTINTEATSEVTDLSDDFEFDFEDEPSTPTQTETEEAITSDTDFELIDEDVSELAPVVETDSLDVDSNVDIEDTTPVTTEDATSSLLDDNFAELDLEDESISTQESIVNDTPVNDAELVESISELEDTETVDTNIQALDIEQNLEQPIIEADAEPELVVPEVTEHTPAEAAIEESPIADTTDEISVFNPDTISQLDALNFDMFDAPETASDIDPALAHEVSSDAPVTTETAMVDDAVFTENFNFVNDLDKNQITLDLAKQYLDLGEYDSARRLINEVISAQASAEYTAQAQALLERIH